jgi:hypothetical protein
MSQTLLLSHMYPNTPEALALANDEPWDDDMYDRAQQHLEAFYIEVFLELANYGEIEDVVVVDNLCDHLIGNVYVKYYHEEDAERALGKLTGRFYSGKLIQAEYTTVSDFREARCRAFHETRCNRGAIATSSTSNTSRRRSSAELCARCTMSIQNTSAVPGPARRSAPEAAARKRTMEGRKRRRSVIEARTAAAETKKVLVVEVEMATREGRRLKSAAP